MIAQQAGYRVDIQVTPSWIIRALGLAPEPGDIPPALRPCVGDARRAAHQQSCRDAARKTNLHA
jgi:hypothetical protein